MAFVWIAACRITAVQRRLITTLAEVLAFLPSLLPLPPTLTGWPITQHPTGMYILQRILWSFSSSPVTQETAD